MPPHCKINTPLTSPITLEKAQKCPTWGPHPDQPNQPLASNSFALRAAPHGEHRKTNNILVQPCGPRETCSFPGTPKQVPPQKSPITPKMAQRYRTWGPHPSQSIEPLVSNLFALCVVPLGEHEKHTTSLDKDCGIREPCHLRYSPLHKRYLLELPKYLTNGPKVPNVGPTPLSPH